MSEILYLGEKDKTMEKHQALSFFLFPFFSLPFLVFFFFFFDGTLLSFLPINPHAQGLLLKSGLKLGSLRVSSSPS